MQLRGRKTKGGQSKDHGENCAWVRSVAVLVGSAGQAGNNVRNDALPPCPDYREFIPRRIFQYISVSGHTFSRLHLCQSCNEYVTVKSFQAVRQRKRCSRVKDGLRKAAVLNQLVHFSRLQRNPD